MLLQSDIGENHTLGRFAGRAMMISADPTLKSSGIWRNSVLAMPDGGKIEKN